MCKKYFVYLITHLNIKHKYNHDDSKDLSRSVRLEDKAKKITVGDVKNTRLVKGCPVNEYCSYVGDKLPRHLETYVLVTNI